MTPTVRQLEYVVALSRMLSFRKAAEACSVSQPSLSSQIQALERMLGIKLFERNRRKVLVTPAGERFVESARKILAEVKDLVDATKSLRNPLAGTLRLGVIPTIAPYLLPRALPSLRRRYPKLRVLICEEQTQNLVDLATRGQLDLLLLALEADLGELTTLALFPDRLLIALPENHPLARKKRLKRADLRGQEVLLLGDGHCLRGQTEPICKAAGACELAEVHAMSLNTLVHMVASDIGITLFPSMAVRIELRGRRGLTVRPFVRPQPYRTVALAWRESSPNRTSFLQVGEVLREASRG